MAENKILDDLAKFGNSTLTAMSGIQRQVRKWVSEQVDTFAANMVSRTEMEASIKTLLNKIDGLEKRIEQLESSPVKEPKAAAPKAPAKPKKPKAAE